MTSAPKPAYSAADRERILNSICENVALGTPLAEIIRDTAGFPSLATIYRWLEESEAWSRDFAHARKAGFDHIAADCIKIADNGGNNPNLAKLRVETRLKLLAKWDPRYADHTQVRLADHEGKQLRDVSEGEAVARVAAILEAARRRAAQSGNSASDETGSI